MNYITSFFTGGSTTQEKKLTEEQESFVRHLKSSNGVFNLLSEDRIQEIMLAQLDRVEFCKIIKVAGKQDKKCEFLESRVTFRVQDLTEKNPVDGEDIEMVIPCLCVQNLAYEEDQDQQTEQFLPLTSDLILLRYHNVDEGKIGLVFFYPSQDSTWVIESDDSTQEQVEDLQDLQDTVCQLIYAIHRKQDPAKESDAAAWKQFCIEVSYDLVYKSKNLYFIVAEDEKKADAVQQEENKLADEDLNQ